MESVVQRWISSSTFDGQAQTVCRKSRHILWILPRTPTVTIDTPTHAPTVLAHVARADWLDPAVSSLFPSLLGPRQWQFFESCIRVCSSILRGQSSRCFELTVMCRWCFFSKLLIWNATKHCIAHSPLPLISHTWPTRLSTSLFPWNRSYFEEVISCRMLLSTYPPHRLRAIEFSVRFVCFLLMIWWSCKNIPE